MEYPAVITPEIKDAANQRRTKARESGAPASTSGQVKIGKKWLSGCIDIFKSWVRVYPIPHPMSLKQPIIYYLRPSGLSSRISNGR